MQTPSIALLALLMLATPALGMERQESQEWRDRIIKTLKDDDRKRQGSEGDRSRAGLSAKGNTDRGVRSAAATAEKRYGGKALAVVPKGDGYRVRLLLDDGRVTTVTIQD